MLMAITRNSDTNRGVPFSDERGDGMTYTALAASIPPDAVRQPGSGQWLKSLPSSLATDFVALCAEPVDRTKVAAWTGRAVRRGAKAASRRPRSIGTGPDGPKPRTSSRGLP